MPVPRREVRFTSTEAWCPYSDKGLWAAVLSHEAAHTALRHQVRVYVQEVYIQRMIAYYRARAAAGDKNANWSLVGFATASRIALKKLERDQEHEADQQGMLLMARAGYHPDYVFALHHMLLMKTGEQSKFGAFFSDHPRWETRDQRSDRVYGDALAEFNRLWPDQASSPGGPAPVVAFIGQPAAKESKATESADVTVPMYCRNSDQPVDVMLAFEKDNHPVKSADRQFSNEEGNLTFHEQVDCREKEETTSVLLHIPASAVSAHDRSLKATAYIGSKGSLIASSKVFDIRFPVASEKGSPPKMHAQSVDEARTVEVRQAKSSHATAFLSETTSTKTATVTETPVNSEGRLSITSSKPGADVFVDSAGHGKTPTSFAIGPGKHSVQVVLNGYEDWVQVVSVESGKTLDVAATLLPLIQAPAETHNISREQHGTPPGMHIESSLLSTQAGITLAQPKNDDTPVSAANTSAPKSNGWIGITGITGLYGVIITELASDGPARKAGLAIADTGCRPPPFHSA